MSSTDRRNDDWFDDWMTEFRHEFQEIMESAGDIPDEAQEQLTEAVDGVLQDHGWRPGMSGLDEDEYEDNGDEFDDDDEDLDEFDDEDDDDED